MPIARELVQLGFSLLATSGTAAALRAHGLETAEVLKVNEGRPHVVEHANALSLIIGDWKVIQARNGQKRNLTGNELGNDPAPQLFDLSKDLGEQNNLASEHPDKVREMLAMLDKMREAGRSRPGF